MKDLSGTTLGQYELIEQIGRGGMAAVYRATQAHMRRNVAVKILPDVLAADANFLARFAREAQTIAQLEHRSILPVYDFGQEGSTTYIVMRYIDTGTLSDRIKAGALTNKEIQRFMRQIAEGLDYAHRQGVVHRDLKPDNIFIDNENNAILGDFGIAQITEGTQELTGNAIIGTPAYMSPEQGQGQKLDGRSDIYALGVILFELFTGHVPFQSETPMGLVVKHITESIPDPRSIKSDVPESVAAVILKATAKRREDRYTTTIELANALDYALANASQTSPLPAAPATAILEAPITKAGTTPISTPQVETAVSKPAPTHAGTATISPTKEATPTTSAKSGGIPKWAWAVGGIVGLILIFGLLTALGGSDDGDETPVATPVAQATTPAANSSDPTPATDTTPISLIQGGATSNNTAPPTPEPPPATALPSNPTPQSAVSVDPPSTTIDESIIFPEFFGSRVRTESITLAANSEQFFAFVNFFGGTVTAEVEPIGEFDVILELYDGQTDTLIQAVDDSFGTETLTFDPSELAGFYYFAVKGFEGATGTYNMTLTGTSEVAFFVGPGDIISGRVNGEENTAGFFFASTPNQTASFTALPDSELDILVALYEATDIQETLETGIVPDPLTSADEFFAGAAETLTFTFPDENAYIISVEGFEGGSGTFVLTVQ